MERANYSDNFESLWSAFDGAYGGKGSKKLAYSVFKSLRCNDGDIDMLMTAINRQRQEKAFAHHNGAFFSNFQEVHRWLKNERWSDEISTAVCSKALSSSDRADEAVRIELERIRTHGE